MTDLNFPPFPQIEFSHAFQPIIDTDTAQVVSYEVLLRGKNSEPPRWVFQQVDSAMLMDFDQFNREQAIMLASRLGLDCRLNLNFTPGSIFSGGGKYVDATLDALLDAGFQARQLVVEITEREAVQSMACLLKVIQKLRRNRITIAVDDFGAGYAGLNMLADIQPDLIKIDAKLLRNIHTDAPRQAIVRAINGACTELGIEVLAEGVEIAQEYRFLRGLNIALFQGFLFARPGFEHLPGVTIPHSGRRSG